jgi:hypothetical protein
MRFSAAISADSIQAEPGASAPASVEVTNHGPEAERFEVFVEGVAAEWTAIPMPTFAVEPNETHSERFFFKPPRASESLAGTYPFIVKVRSLETGEAKEMQGVLEVKPFHHLNIEVSPKMAVIRGGQKKTSVQVVLMNLGNSEHSVQLYASDQNDALAFELEEDQVTLAPGQERTIWATVSGRQRPLLAASRLHPCSISIRSTAHPAIGAAAQLQVEQRALVSPGSGVLAMASVALAAGWFALLPKQPEITSFSVSPEVVETGQPVTISWTTEHAGGLELILDDGETQKRNRSGSITWVPKRAGDFQITAAAIYEDRRSDDRKELVQVNEPVKAPAPVIELFDIQPRDLKVGQTMQISYRVSPSVTSATLSPVGLRLDTNADGVQLIAKVAGTAEYKILAYNRDGVMTEQSILITAEDASLATIQSFNVFPTRIPVGSTGTVTVSWRLRDARRAELLIGEESIEIDTVTGRYEIPIAVDTMIELVAYDENGKTVSDVIEVVVTDLLTTRGPAGSEGPADTPPAG